MLRVRVEVVRWGREEWTTNLSTVYVGNDGTGDHETGNYDVYIEDPRTQPELRNARELRNGWVGRIENFPRFGENRSRDRLAELALSLARDPDRVIDCAVA